MADNSNWPADAPPIKPEDGDDKELKAFYNAVQHIAGTKEGQIMLDRIKAVAWARSFEPGMEERELYYNEGMRNLALELCAAAGIV